MIESFDKRWALRTAAIVLAGAASVGAFAAQPGVPAAATGASDAAPAQQQSGTAASAHPLKPDPAYASLPRYEGTLGGRRIVVHLGPKTDEPGVHGEYQYADTDEVVLLAGDRDGDTLEAEESDDGTNITGVWMGTFDASGALSADRMNPDESDPQPVVLHPVAAQSAPPGRPGAAAAGTVGGVANLRTAD